MCSCVQVPHGVAVIGGFEPLNVGVGNWTQVPARALCALKSLKHLSSPRQRFLSAFIISEFHACIKCILIIFILYCFLPVPPDSLLQVSLRTSCPFLFLIQLTEPSSCSLYIHRCQVIQWVCLTYRDHTLNEMLTLLLQHLSVISSSSIGMVAHGHLFQTFWTVDWLDLD